MSANKRLFVNIFSGAAIQSLEYIFPLLIMPLMLRSVGSEAYGKYIFYQAICGYGVLLVEYGFMHSTSKLVAGNSNVSRVSEIYFTVFSLRLVAAISFVTVVVLFIFLFGSDPLGALLAAAASLSVFGAALYPSWFLQATEKIKIGMIFNIKARLITLCFIFFLVKSPSDIYLAAFVLSSTSFIAGIGVNFYLLISNTLSPRAPRVDLALSVVREGFQVFKAIVSSSFYRSINPIILGLMCPPSVLAWYSVIERIIKASQEVLRPISQACYPRIVVLTRTSRIGAMKFIFKLLIASFSIGLAISASLIFFSESILAFLSGTRSEWTVDTISLLRFMSIIPVVGIANSVIGIQTYIPFGMDKLFSNIVFSVSVLSLFFIWPVVYFYKDFGAAAVYLSSESLLFFLLVLGLRRNGLLELGRKK